MASTSRANWLAERVVVPLKTMCSMKWEMPLTSGDSSREPQSIQTPMATERRWGMDSVRTSRPLGRVVVRMSRRCGAEGARVAAGAGNGATGTEIGIGGIVSWRGVGRDKGFDAKVAKFRKGETGYDRG